MSKRSIPALPLKLLVLEDEKDSREATELLFRGEGYDVVSTSSGEHAIEAVQNSTTPFYAMVMDIRMDGRVDGLKATQTIQQELNRNIPALILSAFNNHEYQTLAERYRLKITGWVGKPDVENQTMVYVRQLADAAYSVEKSIVDAFHDFISSPEAGLQRMRSFLREKVDYDPLIIPYVLGRLEESSPDQISDFIAQVNFLTFEVQGQVLLEKYKEGFVAFLKGALVGHHENEDELIRDVYKKKRTTDFFVARLHPDIVHSPAGDPVQFRRWDGFLR